MRRCKACEYTSEIHKKTVEAEVERLSKMKGLRLCGDGEKQRRLEICSNCAHLDINGVCMMCGCYVQLRALPQSGHCPMKQW